MELLRKTREPVAFAPERAASSPPDAIARRFASQKADDSFFSSPPSAVAGYVRLAAFHDVYDRSIDEIQEEISEVIDGEPGEYKIDILYWEGQMHRPNADGIRRFQYDFNPRGEVVSKAESIYFTIEEGE